MSRGIFSNKGDFDMSRSIVIDSFSGSSDVTKTYTRTVNEVCLYNDGSGDVTLYSVALKNSTQVSAASNSGQQTLKVTDTSCFKVGNSIIIGRGTVREEIATISAIPDTNTLTVSANLGQTHTQAQADTVEKCLKFTIKAGDVPFDERLDEFKTLIIKSSSVAYRCIVRG